MKYQIGVADYGMEVWDDGNFNLEKRLALLKDCGIDGIEWLQASDMAEAVQNACTFHRMGMDFASCSVNSPELTMKCACAFGKKYIWNTVAPQRTVPMETYIRRSNCMAEACEAYGLKAALHNHLGCRIQDREELDEYMEKVPGSYLLLDIGHLHAAADIMTGLRLSISRIVSSRMRRSVWTAGRSVCVSAN